MQINKTSFFNLKNKTHSNIKFKEMETWDSPSQGSTGWFHDMFFVGGLDSRHITTLSPAWKKGDTDQSLWPKLIF